MRPQISLIILPVQGLRLFMISAIHRLPVFQTIHIFNMMPAPHH